MPLLPVSVSARGWVIRLRRPARTSKRSSSWPPPQPASYAYQQGSLWSTGPSGLLGDKRARSLGDLLTVVIEIDEEAEIRVNIVALVRLSHAAARRMPATGGGAMVKSAYSSGKPSYGVGAGIISLARTALPGDTSFRLVTALAVVPLLLRW